MDYQRAFQILNMPPRTYVLTRGIPIVVAGLVLSVLLGVFGGLFLPPLLRVLAPLLVMAFFVMLAVVYPLSAADRKRSEIDNALPFFMTHFGVLSTSNMPRTEVFRMLGTKTEYGALADELLRIHSLVEDWNMSLPEACRFVSQATPSQIFSDFLERLAHAMETGHSLEAFLRSEQDVVMKEYATVYETAIYQIENWKDIYVSVVMSGAFFVIFAVITPIITGSSPETLLMGVLAFVLFMEILLVMLLKVRVPHDQLHHRLAIVSAEKRRVRLLLGGTILASLALLPMLYLLAGLPLEIAIISASAPLGATGYVARRMEDRIKRREDNYSAFIRSVGASAAARGGALRDVLRSVRRHNFGPLTQLVHNLFSRLTWRLDDRMAWKHFSAESGSNLIDSFNDMFVEGANTGGKPDLIGEIISENVVRIMNLRKARYSTAGTFRGNVIGLTASMAFVMFLGVGILGVLGDIFATAGTSDIDPDLAPVQVNFDVDLVLVEELIFWLIVSHCLLAGIMLKMVDGGSTPAGLSVFLVLLWLSIGLAYLSQQVIPNLFSIGGQG